MRPEAWEEKKGAVDEEMERAATQVAYKLYKGLIYWAIIMFYRALSNLNTQNKTKQVKIKKE